ncbi:MAG TPA: hypothetical protein ENG51_15935 [Deltaproteobacteria bacterium]|nr:MAG: hypothetical protein DRN83_02730 [Hadesarchaea archaeon]HDM77932.1 hypothetical protein [Deltaproteobacteria bacterium]
MNPSIIIGLLLSAFCFASVGGTDGARACGLSELATIFILCLTNATIILIWFGFVETIDSRLSNFLKHKRNNYLSNCLDDVQFSKEPQEVRIH